MSSRTRRRRKRDSLRNPTDHDYRLYINKVCKKKKRDPRTRMSRNFARGVNALLNQWMERIGMQAGKLCRASGRKTLSISHIRKAICITLPPEVAQKAVEHLNLSLVSLKNLEHTRELRRLH